MAEIVRFHSEQGSSVLVETVGRGPGMREVGVWDAIRDADASWESVLRRVRELSDQVAGQVATMVTKPDEVTVELGVSINAESQIVVAKASAEGTLKITMKWNASGRGSGTS